MLTGKMVRVRYARDRIIPHYLDVTDPTWLEIAERMLELFRGQEGVTRGELEADQREAFGDDPGQLVHQGLAKLLEDRCEFEVVSGPPPDKLPAALFPPPRRAPRRLLPRRRRAPPRQRRGQRGPHRLRPHGRARTGRRGTRPGA